MTDIHLPLADCHVHANGMTTDQQVLRLARKYQVDLSQFSFIGTDGRRDWAGDHHSVSHEAYDETVSLIREPADLLLVVESGLRRQSEKGCIYTRLLSSCLNNYREDCKMSEIDVFEANALAIIKGIKNARLVGGIEAFLSISAKRHLKKGPLKAHRLLDAYEAFRKKHPEEAVFITGFDLAGNEEKTRIVEFKDVYARVHSLGLGGSAHAGEVRKREQPDSDILDVWDALALPGILQISHALSAIRDPLLMKALQERQILIDQLLVSNAILHDIAGDTHPLPQYMWSGLRLGLGSDDPGIQRSDITDDYARAEKYGLTAQDRLELTANSVRFAFAPAGVRLALLNSVGRAAQELAIPLRPSFLTLPQGRDYETRLVA